jgi:hypothetical protein
MDTLIAAAALAVLGTLTVLVGVVVYRLGRAGACQEPLLLHRVMEREKASLDGRTDQTTLVQAAAAARRCILCRERETCLAWLGEETDTPLERFCPNADLITRLKAERTGQ